jgi:hypothetical protein
MDEVAVFNYTLTPAQVNALYTTALAGALVTVNCQSAGTNLVLSWTHCTLVKATNLAGPWTPVTGAAPPSFNVTLAGQMFYRVRVYP